MRGKSETIRFIGFVACLLVFYPTLFAFFIHSSSYSESLRTSFLLFRQPLLAILAMTLFFLFAKSGRGDRPVAPTLSRWREFNGFFLIGTLCLALSAITQIDLNRILNEGISFSQADKKVQWDTKRWGGIPFLSESDPVGEQYLWVHTPDQRLMKTLQSPVGAGFKPAPTTIKWYAIWRDGNGNGILDDQVWLSVNGQKYDVTEQYRGIPPMKPVVLELGVPTLLMVSGLNDLILHKTGAADSIGWVGQTSYLTGETREWRMSAEGGSASGGENGKWGQTPFMEAMVWVDQPSGVLYTLLFKMGWLLRWAGMLLFFFAFFGRRWVLSFVKHSPVLTAVSFIYAPLILFLGIGLRQSWPWLAQGIGWSLYGLLKLGFNPIIHIPDPSHVEVGIATFKVNIADTCSGIESLGLFAGIYAGLILFNWRSLRFSRALLLLIPGLVGIYLVNAVRVYLLFLIGLIAGNSALDLFHTYLGMFVFVLYFLFFWQKSQRWISSNGAGVNIGKLQVVPSIISGLMVLFLLTGYEMTNPTEKTIAAVTYSYYCEANETRYCGGGGGTSCGARVAGRQECPAGYEWGPMPSCPTPCLTCGDMFDGWYTANCIAVPEFPLFFPALLSLGTAIVGVFKRKRQC